MLLTAVPTPDSTLTAPQWAERIARHYGKPSPACSRIEGQRVKGPQSKVVDKFGVVIESTPMKGDGWRQCHDKVKHGIAMLAYSLGITCDVEVFNLFADLFGPDVLQELQAHGVKYKQGIVPDFRIQRLLSTWSERLMELKKCNLAACHYKLDGSTHSRRSSAACTNRARTIRWEYESKAKALDRKHFPAPVPQPTSSPDDDQPDPDEGQALQPPPGPVQSRLAQLGPIHPLVFGAFNDVNKGFEDLVRAMVDYGASQLWRPMLARNIAEARGALYWKIRRTIGMTMHRANADLILHRVPRVGSRAAAAEDRRELASRLQFESGGPSTVTASFRQASIGYHSLWH